MYVWMDRTLKNPSTGSDCNRRKCAFGATSGLLDDHEFSTYTNIFSPLTPIELLESDSEVAAGSGDDLASCVVTDMCALSSTHDTCDEVEMNGVKTTICYCGTNGCNDTNQVRPGSYPTLVGICGVLMLMAKIQR